MKKTKSLKKILLGTLMGGVALSALSIPVMIGSYSDPLSAATFSNASSTDLTITVYDRSGIAIDPASDDSSITVGSQTYTLNGYNWEDVSYFSIKYNNVSSIPSGFDQYKYSFTATYSQESSNGTSIDLKTDRAVINTILSTSATSKDDIKDTIKFYIDDTNMSGQYSYSSTQIIGNDSIIGEQYLKNGEWGLYQFSFAWEAGTNNGSTSSNIIELKPTDVSSISSPLQIETRIISSQFSIDNAYLFNIKMTNQDGSDSYRYNYIDRRKLVWDVTGTSHNGTKYRLLASDIPTEDTTTLAIYETYDNTGLSFKLDFDIGGTWSVTCKAVASTPEDTKMSAPVEVTNVNLISQNVIIYIVVGIVVLAIAALITIITITKRKERIW